MIYAAKKQVIDAYFGTKKVLKAYLGDAQVYASKLSVSVTIGDVTTTSTVANGDSYTKVLTATGGKQALPWTVEVLMGETDITSTAYNASTNTVTIASVEAAVTITAEAVTMNSAYRPKQSIGVSTRTNDNSLELPYVANSNTYLEIDVNIIDGGYPKMLYACGGVAGTPSTGNEKFFAYASITASSGSMAFGKNASTNGAKAWLLAGTRFKFICNKGKMDYYRHTGGHVTDINFSYTGDWNMGNNNLRIFGRDDSSAPYSCAGTLYRVTIKEGGTTLQDYMPCERVSDNVAGLYDIVNGTYIQASNYTAS